MNDLKKYKEVLMYAGLLVVIAYFAFTQVQPLFNKTIQAFNDVKSQTSALESLTQQLNNAREKAERKKKLSMLDDMTKKIYEPNGAATDSESTFAVLLDDIIEISRKNHIKTYSITSEMNPENDVFIKGDKDHFSACRLSMKIISDYTDFENFITDLYKYNYLVNINSIEIYPYSKNKRILLINFDMTLYTMKTEEELKSEQDQAKENKEGGEQPQDGQAPPPPEGEQQPPQ